MKKMITTKNSNILFYLVNTNGQGEVGFLIKTEFKSNIVEVGCFSCRTAKLIIKLDSKNLYVIIQIASTETEIEEFYSDLGNAIALHSNNKKFQLIILGDFNSQKG